MKKIYLILLCIGLAVGFLSCEKDKEFELTTLSISTKTITPSHTSATVCCVVTGNATVDNVYVHYSTKQDFAEYEEVKMVEEEGEYTAQLIGLQDNTLYYCRYAADNRFSSLIAEGVEQFQTLQATLPNVILDSLGTVWDTSAQAHVKLEFDGGANVTEVGVCWNTQMNPTHDNNRAKTADTVAILDLTSLQPNTTYYVRAYAVNKVGVAYSEEKVFTTFAVPEVRTEEVTDIRLNSAQLTATLLFDGNDSITVKGFCWSTTKEPTMSDNHIIVESESANYTCLIADLLAETQYYARAFAQNKIGVAYGEEKSFKTQKTLPILTTSDVTEITETSVTIRGYVISDGGSEIIERGVVYSTSQSPTIGDNKITAGSGKGEFYCKLEDLQKGVVYYVRAYAENEIGIAYGAERSFMTDIPLTPADGTENGYGYVDLGLSVKWATMNVGATKPEEYGNYYAWGEVEVKDTYSWYFYKYCEGTYNSLTKYNTSIYSETKDDKITLETMDDVASVNWGGLWRMPTEKEVAELREKCTCSWTGINGVLGYKITSKSNGKSIFLPAAGFRDNSSLISDPAYGYYWSSSLNTDLSYNARALWFSSNSIGGTDCERCDGLSIRSVCDEITIQAVKPTIMTTTVTQITETSAVAGGNVTSDVNAEVTERGVVYSTVSNPVINNIYHTTVKSGSGTGSFSVNLTNLVEGTMYYVRAYATNSKGTSYGEEVSFTTRKTDITDPTGTENGHAYVDLGLSVKWATMNVGASTAEEYGDYFAWGETQPKDTYDWSTYKYCNGSSTTLTQYNTSSIYGTVDNKVQLELSDDAARANWGGSWRMPTDAEWTELREQCTWTFTSQYGVFGCKVTSKKNGNRIFLPAAGYRGVSSLNSAGSYGDYWSSSLNTGGSSYAWDIGFESDGVLRGYRNRYYGSSVRPVLGTDAAPVELPMISTISVTNVTETTAVAGGNVTSDGNAEVTERGVVYATTQNPTTANSKIVNGSGTGSYTCNLTGLQAGTTYYVRAYATNSKGTSYGEEVTFTTALPTALANVTTSAITQITETTAVAGGNVTSDGNATVTEKGVVYSTTQNPTTADSKVVNGSGTGSYTCNLTGLQAGTTYYVRAYATNSKGTSYGEEVTFTTALSTALANVTTSAITQITETTATAGGNVTSDGNATVTERGVVYSTSQNPTTASNKVISGSGTGSYTCNLTGLQDGTTYYVRAYAINSKGTTYGNQVSFTTTSYALPTVTTATASNVTTTSATVGGNVTSDGNAEVTERGVVYSTVSNPVINNIYHTTVKSGSGTGSFSVNLTNLVAGTTYYVRAYAVNSKGTAYGEQVSFTTNEQSSTPNEGTENGYAYVDLGLSVKWATCNVGASKPEDYGDYFAWGETTTKSTYSWSTYKYCNGSSSTLTKYNNSSSYGTVDNKTVLELSDDAARANWGGSWRMPTDAEWTELRTECTCTWTTQNGVNGYKVTGSNGKSIFLPAAGLRGSSLYDAGSYGNYWSSSLDTDDPYSAYVLYFFSGYVNWYGYYRYYGLSVRPVCQ